MEEVQVGEVVYIETAKGVLPMKRVKKLDILGCRVTDTNDDGEAMTYRRGKAEGVSGATARLIEAKVPLKQDERMEPILGLSGAVWGGRMDDHCGHLTRNANVGK